jgi:MoxR-like ATPase
MAEPIHDKIKRSLQAAEGLYHRLVLLVGETGSGKTSVLRDIAEEFDSIRRQRQSGAFRRAT